MCFFYIPVQLPCLLMLPSVSLPSLCVCTISHVCVCVCVCVCESSTLHNSLMSLKLSYCTLHIMSLKLSYCTLHTWPVIPLTDNYTSLSVISLAFGFSIIIIFILSCELIKVHVLELLEFFYLSLFLAHLIEF